MLPLSLRNIPGSFVNELPSRFCAPPVSVATTHAGGSATLLATPFDGLVVAVSATTFLLIGSIALALLVHRGGRHTEGGWWLFVLALASIAFAALTLVWIWQLRATYVAGCLIYFNATPFSQEQANVVAPAAFLGIATLLALWLCFATRFALVRRSARK